MIEELPTYNHSKVKQVTEYSLNYLLSDAVAIFMIKHPARTIIKIYLFVSTFN